MNATTNIVPQDDMETQKAFVYRHIVSFEETNLVGNVYFSRHIGWQGRCREMFLKEHAPDTLQELMRDLRLITIRVACDYYEELEAFDIVTIEMRLDFVRSNRIGLIFDYLRHRNSSKNHVARGFQEVGCFRLSESGLSPCAIPIPLTTALRPFAARTSEAIFN